MRRALVVAGSVFFAQNFLAQGATTVIHAGRMLDGRGGTLRDVTIVVEGSKITRVDTSPAKRRAADYELGTLTVLPGLIDSHAHLAWYFNRAGKLHTANDGDSPAQSVLAAAGNAYTTLLAGFTTIQSPGSFEDKDLRDAIASGAIPGPRVLTSLEPLEDPTLSPDSLRKLVRERKKQGADFIKIFASKSIRQGGAATMSVAQMEAMCGEARAQGLRTLVHAHSTESIERSIRAGCTQIEHGLFATDDVLKEMAQRGTIFDPQCGLIYLRTISITARNSMESATSTRQGLPRWKKRFRLLTRLFNTRLRFRISRSFLELTQLPVRTDEMPRISFVA